MTTEQLKKLLDLYKSAIRNNLTIEDFEQEIKKAKIEMDSFFVQNGKENTNLGEYLEELIYLKEISKL